MLTVLDPAARQSALLTGDVDLIDQVDLKTVAMFERAPGVNVLSATGTQHYTFAMDTRAAPFDARQRAAGAEMRGGPAGTRGQDPLRLWRDRQ